MNLSTRLTGAGSTISTVSWVIRWVLGLFFIYMGMSKALHPPEFLKAVRAYELVASAPALNLVAVVLPWLEVFCGLLLLAGVAVRGCALLLSLLLVGFTVAIVARALSIQGATAAPFCSLRFDCGCGGGEVFVCRKVVENVCLTVLGSLLVFWDRSRFCLRFSLFGG